MIKPQNKMLFIIGSLLVIIYCLFRLNQRPVYVCNYNNFRSTRLNEIDRKLLQETDDDTFLYLIQSNQAMYQYAKEHMSERLTNQ